MLGFAWRKDDPAARVLDHPISELLGELSWPLYDQPPQPPRCMKRNCDGRREKSVRHHLGAGGCIPHGTRVHPVCKALSAPIRPAFTARYILHVVVWRCYQRFVDGTFPPNFFPFLLVLPAVVCRALHLPAPSLFDG